MNYIIVLNWNAAQETINCIKSLCLLKNLNQTRIIICDNDSNPESYQLIRNFLSQCGSEVNYIELLEQDLETYSNDHSIYLIKNSKNYGYAGGNNVGIKFALQFEQMQYVWILNNDTIVQPDSLKIMLEKAKENLNYGVIGSRLVELSNQTRVQGIGGIINPMLCTTHEVGKQFSITDLIDEQYFERKIDYVIGASLLLSRRCLETVGLLCEDYFLYYEEIDYCNRAKAKGFQIGIASKSIIFHEQGASTGKGKSEIADFCSVKNRILISQRFYRKYNLICRMSIIGVCCIRIYRLQFSRAFRYLNLIFKHNLNQ